MLNTINIMIIGDFSTGKSTMIFNFTENKHMDYSLEGITFYVLNLSLQYNKQYKLRIWEITNNEYLSYCQTLKEEIDIFIFLFDLSNNDSFLFVQKANNLISSHPLKIFVGNKKNSSTRMISYEKLKDYGNKHNSKTFEISTADTLDVNIVFNFAFNSFFNFLILKNN